MDENIASIVPWMTMQKFTGSGDTNWERSFEIEEKDKLKLLQIVENGMGTRGGGQSIVTKKNEIRFLDSMNDEELKTISKIPANDSNIVKILQKHECGSKYPIRSFIKDRNIYAQLLKEYRQFTSQGLSIENISNLLNNKLDDQMIDKFELFRKLLLQTHLDNSEKIPTSKLLFTHFKYLLEPRPELYLGKNDYFMEDFGFVLMNSLVEMLNSTYWIDFMPKNYKGWQTSDRIDKKYQLPTAFFTSQGLIIIKPLYERLSDKDKAALIFHELVRYVIRGISKEKLDSKPEKIALQNIEKLTHLVFLSTQDKYKSIHSLLPLEDRFDLMAQRMKIELYYTCYLNIGQNCDKYKDQDQFISELQKLDNLLGVQRYKRVNRLFSLGDIGIKQSAGFYRGIRAVYDKSVIAGDNRLSKVSESINYKLINEMFETQSIKYAAQIGVENFIKSTDAEKCQALERSLEIQ
ncbi:MAG: hypothetical protein ACOYOK_05160 [Pseudobdellovibrionaceae bacterium]